MDADDDARSALRPPAAGAARGAPGRPLGPDAAAILATEHWSLLGTRSLIWSEAMSRTTVFMTVLSAAVVALALLADATGFGGHTTLLALALLPVVLVLGIATYIRLLQINQEDLALVLAMNRLRHAYLQLAPELEPYFTTGHHDDERGLTTTLLLGLEVGLHPWVHFFITTPTIVATVDAALATAIVAIAARAVGATTEATVAAGAATFLLVWGVLFLAQRSILVLLRHRGARFPTPPAQR